MPPQDKLFRFEDLDVWQRAVEYCRGLWKQFQEGVSEFPELRSAFECANMLLIFERQGALQNSTARQHLDELGRICRMITVLSRALS